MKGRNFEGAGSPSECANGSSTTRPPHLALQPNWNCRKVQAALEHLASIDLNDLCNEAKVEHCRATRDLRTCGRYVQSVLNSCGHAALCEECSQRCDACPICRLPVPKNENKLRLRLYYECIEAGLISKRYDDRFQEKDGEKQLTVDVERLFNFFYVALENNLTSLICHYITDVCMDENAVSSDPVVALLLDEVVVKDWCKRTFTDIIVDLQCIYSLPPREMKEKMNSLLKFSVKLGGLSNVLEVLESSFKGSLSTQLHDVHHLQESVLKTKQHMEVMMWCIRHEFLEGIKSRHAEFTAWRSDFRDRKSAAIKRSWPNPINHPVESEVHGGFMLFIEDALTNLGTEQDYSQEIASIQKDGGTAYSRSRIEGLVGFYPFEDLHSASDRLFLCGSSDLVLAKQAIFVYYLFDRQWRLPEEQWRYVVDDFAVTFNITRHSMLESLTFYLLDDHTGEALKEACQLLPEISGPTSHPKIAQVLLERQSPEAALMFLRWSGRDNGTELVVLAEAVTAVRVRVESGLLTEAFMYQRSICTKVKENKVKHEFYKGKAGESRCEGENWMNWVEVLVTEICILCIRRNMVDRIIELPWNSDEERYLCKFLLDFALEDPSSAVGSLLVVFHLQRYRFIEAYQIDYSLQSAEQDIISKKSSPEDVLHRMKSTSLWRKRLIDKSLKLLSEVEQQKLKAETLPDVVSFSAYNSSTEQFDPHTVQEPTFASVFLPASVDSQLNDASLSSNTSVPDAPLKVGGSLNVSPLLKNVVTQDNTESNLKRSSIDHKFKFNGITSSATPRVRPVTAAPLREFNSSSSRIPLKSLSSDKEQNVLMNQFQISSPYFRRVAGDSVTSISGNAFEASLLDSLGKVAGRYVPSGSVGASNNLKGVSWSNTEEAVSEQINANGGPRWRSDDVSEDEEEPSPDKLMGHASYDKPSGITRRNRSIRR